MTVGSTEQQTLLFRQEGETSIHLIDVPVSQCRHSRFNTRKTRSPEDIQKLAERMRRMGFERTRALWAVNGPENTYEVFAGGTRLESAKLEELDTVPIMLHAGFTNDQISRRADFDNECDEYHAEVSILDVWAEYHRLWKEEGWTQQRIAEAKDIDRKQVTYRIKWHTSLPEVARVAVFDRKLDEGHIEAISDVMFDVEHFSIWMTTIQAQTELVAEVLGKHRGITEGIKPTVKIVREAASRWKALISSAETAYNTLPESHREAYVKHLCQTKARTIAAVNTSFSAIQRQASDEAQAKADTADAEAKAQRKASERAAHLETLTRCIVHGDARQYITQAPEGFHLLLTDPPYGMEFQSHRAKVTPLKEPIANDRLSETLSLLTDVLKEAYMRMATDSTLLLFTGWRYEPEIRQVVQDAGFTVKGSLIWVKPNHGTGDLVGSFAPKHERILHAVKGNPALKSRPPDVFEGKEFRRSEHPTQKPVDLIRKLIEATTDINDIVVDSFAGSGNVLFESLALQRRFYGIEIDEQWYRRIVDEIYTLANAQEVL
jgi:site-specific DNA-methyltransferase (adenine-specific)